jgi:site-specific recombinase XerD
MSQDVTHYHPPAAIVTRQSNPMRDWLAGQLSQETRRAYASDLRAFMAWAAERQAHTLGDVTRGVLIAYRDDLKARGYAVASIARKLSCIRQALEYAFAEGLIPSNPAKTVKAYKVPDVSPRHALDAAQVRALLAQPNRATLKGARDYAILSVLLYLGMRRSEVAGLSCAQFGEERSHTTLHVHGKGGKVRLLPVPPQVGEAILSYLEQDGRADAFSRRAEAPLFRPTKNPRYGNRTDKTLTADAIWRMVKRFALAAGIAEIDVHTLRHTPLTAALDGGASLRRVQAMAGHSDPKTTARYDSRRGGLDESAVYRVDYSS